jgi:hypothetical protein
MFLAASRMMRSARLYLNGVRVRVRVRSGLGLGFVENDAERALT